MKLSPSQDRLLRRASYRENSANGLDFMRLTNGERRSAQALANFGFALTSDGRLYSTRKGEVQIQLEDDRIARQVRRARRK